MITITQLGSNIIELAVLEQPSDDDIRNAMFAIQKQTESGTVAILADMGGRSRPEAVLDLIFDHIAPRYSRRFSKLALVGKVGEEDLEDVKMAMGIETAVFADTRDALSWLR